MIKDQSLSAVSNQFRIPGEFLSASPYGSGHINDTYCAVFDQARVTVRYILQRINTHIFEQQQPAREGHCEGGAGDRCRISEDCIAGGS
jgi:hypothetical protein